ncbi:phage tail protein [Sphingomonas sp. SUN019]|uniref:phage tail protein n=1 Tax=Sphingomonas sp. SUN019 TaxID=2937788 RepID=UPI002164CCA2|nr:phage tail protein [Sphingomonas sp. SUN019]UVO51437.1 phage tail protein [Sphingomonas sp. SUN019]
MATLILTTVGGVLGGPIGAAIGGLLGVAADGRLLKPKGRQGPRLTELAVQTSSYGSPIAKIFGTMRVAGTVIWATDLIETREKRSGGKGQPSTTTYNYAASFAVALSGRPVRSVGRIWAEGKLLRGAAGDWKATTGFRLHSGGEDQAVDPLIASAEGIGLAPAHRGIAYVVFENLALADFGNRIPSLTFEVVADDAPVAIGRIAREIGDGVVTGEGPGARVDGFSAYGDGVRGVLETLAEASGAWFAPVGDTLAMRSDVGATVAVEDAGTGGARRMRTIAPLETVPLSVSVAHYDPARDYQAGVQRARRPGTGMRAEAVEMPAALSADAAKTMAEAMLARAEAVRVRRRVTTDVSALGIGPGDGVTITGESGVWRVREATLEKMAVTLELTPVVAATLPATASGGRVLGAPDAAIGTTIVHAFETPALGDTLLTVPRLTIVAAGSEPGWRRAALLYSLDDGVTWIAAGGTAAAGTIGIVVSPPGSGSATLVDRFNTIEVELAHEAMTLESADPPAIDRGANLALVGDELLQFELAEPIGARRWRLSGLWRARRGMAGAPPGAGARFVLIEADSSLTLPVDVTPGATIRVMASGAGDTGGAAETMAVMTGASILPPAPVGLTALPTADGGAMLRWARRSRIGWRWSDAVDAPLGEEREAYRVTIAPAAGAARTIETVLPETMLTAGERAGGPVAITVRQLGTNGESPALSAAI